MLATNTNPPYKRAFFIYVMRPSHDALARSIYFLSQRMDTQFHCSALDQSALELSWSSHLDFSNFCCLSYFDT